MSGHHPYPALAAKLTATSEGRVAVDQWRRQMESAVSLSPPAKAADHTRAEAASDPLPLHPDEE